MTSWFLFLFCHGLICTVLMGLGTSIEKDPNSPLASCFGLRTKLSKSSPKYWDYSQHLYGSLMKKGGASLLITCFICMLCVLGQSQLMVSLAGGILFGLEVLFYGVLHLYCQRKVAEHFGLMAQEADQKQDNAPLNAQKESIQAKPKEAESNNQIEEKVQTPLSPQEMEMEVQDSKQLKELKSEKSKVEKEETLSKSSQITTAPTQSALRLAKPIVEEKKPEEPGFTRRIVFDRIPIQKEVKSASSRPKLSRTSKNKELKEESSSEESESKGSLNSKAKKTSLNTSEHGFQTLLFDYKADFQEPISMTAKEQEGPSFRVLSSSKPSQVSSVEPIVFQEENLEKEIEETQVLTPFGPKEKQVTKDQEQEMNAQKFFRSSKKHIFESEQEEYIASTVVFHDPQQPQPVYHRANSKTKDSVDTHGFFFDPQSQKSDCPLKKKREKCPHNTIKPDPQSSFRYRHIAASMRQNTLNPQTQASKKKHPQKSLAS